ncbi:DUF2254 domain-containing protein [Cerasicoccus fimbriatus]|uniref:DUF2254 domain-containing protein n=1 Tax=Cerasicoccus fimbriatus TaxID=3014554 RepID=UPI0022B48E47|nr:DUF2254 domain-containing protein [Cerasicoccus sp. TK19100]
MMNFSLPALWLRILQSFWFIPALLAGAAIVAAVGMNALDHAIGFNTSSKLAWFMQTPEGARTILSTISGSIITVTGVLLSTMVVVLTLASQQYGPRLVQNFIEDRPSQFVIGTFCGCFIYNIITLKNVSSGDTSFVPNISVLFAVLFSLMCIGLMIYFVQHVASSIQVQSIMRRVYSDLNEAVDELFPEEVARPSTEEISVDDVRAQLEDGPAEGLIELSCLRAGYLQFIRDSEILRLVEQHDLLLELCCLPGEFMVKGQALARVRCRRSLHDEAREKLLATFVIGTFPTHEQDVMFPIRQMEEIAIRALSPGINDPHTAEECIDYLACAFRVLATRPWPDTLRVGQDGQPRLITRTWSFEKLLRGAFQQTFFYGREDITIVRKVLIALNDIAETCEPGSDRRKTVTEFARELAQAGGDSLPLASHREQMPVLVE